MPTSERRPREKARMSVNDLALYMVSSDTMKLSIIRRNKFPSNYVVLPYQDAKPWLVNFLTDPGRDKTKLAEGIEHFRHRAADSSLHETKRNDAVLCGRVLESFFGTYGTLGLGQMEFVRTPGKLAPLQIEGVDISIPLDLIAHQSIKGVDHAGGIIFRLTQADESDAAKERRKQQGHYAASLAHLQMVSKKPTAREPAPRLSFSVDVQHQQAFPAKAGASRITNLTSACRMISGIWPTIT